MGYMGSIETPRGYHKKNKIWITFQPQAQFFILKFRKIELIKTWNFVSEGSPLGVTHSTLEPIFHNLQP